MPLQWARMKVPQLVAHRGYAHRFPENSLEGLGAALEVGACFLEFDVQLTADAAPVLLHDADLERTAGVPDRIIELTLEQLAEIEVNEEERLGGAFRNVRIPTLESAIDLVHNWPRAEAFVEIKPDSLAHFGVDAVGQRVVADLRRAPLQCILICSTIEILDWAREAGLPRIGWVVQEWSEQSRARAEALHPDYLFCNTTRLPADPEPLWEGPWQWAIYEVVDPELALELAGRGADLIETMAIAEMLADPILATRGCLG